MKLDYLCHRLSSWIRERAQEAGSSGVVFGLSGGVDSAVVGGLCRDAFPNACLGIIMPCYSDPADAVDAELVAREFGIPVTTVVLDPVFDCLLSAVSKGRPNSIGDKIAQANLKPRLRMCTLYYFANRLNYLVVGTSNRSERAIGYSTKYGDSGVDILPLGNLLKTDILRLATHLGVPSRIFDKPPSAGLWEGQTDEGEMGFTYGQLDEYLTTGRAAAEVQARIESLAAGAEHKRTLPPTPPFE